MKKISALLIATGLVAVSAPAFAQDATPAQNFDGLRVEGLVGYDHHRSGSSVDNDTTRNIKQSIDGVVYGVGIGYDMATGSRMTVGAEAEVTDSSAGWDNNNGVPNTFNLGRVDAGRDLYVGARVGYAVAPNTLVYVKGGYTNARYALKGSDGTVNLSQRLDTDGWRAGAGVEQKVGSNAYVKAEYRYSNYSRGEFDFNGNTPDSSRFKIDTDRHQVMVGAGLRF